LIAANRRDRRSTTPGIAMPMESTVRPPTSPSISLRGAGNFGRGAGVIPGQSTQVKGWAERVRAYPLSHT
jgi:hypothetical protein